MFAFVARFSFSVIILSVKNISPVLCQVRRKTLINQSVCTVWHRYVFWRVPTTELGPCQPIWCVTAVCRELGKCAIIWDVDGSDSYDWHWSAC